MKEINKEEQKKLIIEMMEESEKDGLYVDGYVGMAEHNPSHKLHINTNYNVGGCTNPSAKLEVKETRVFESGSQRDNDTNKPLPNHLDAYVRMRYGYLLRYGANHYDKGNWRKGQPTEAALESLHRHLAKFEMNLYNGLEQDEDHLSAIIFGCQLIMKNEEKEGISAEHYYKPI